MSLGLHNIHYTAQVGLAECEDGQKGQAGSRLSSTAPSILKSRATSAHRVERVCENAGCGRLFLARISEAKRGWGRFCSISCSSSAKARRQHQEHPQVGAANHNFKGGRSRDKRAYVNRFRAKYPEKAAAHDAVKLALASGRLVRPVACQMCSATPEKPLHAHHDDYSEPLVVIFACRDCHRQLDATRPLAGQWGQPRAFSAHRRMAS